MLLGYGIWEAQWQGLLGSAASAIAAQSALRFVAVAGEEKQATTTGARIKGTQSKEILSTTRKL